MAVSKAMAHLPRNIRSYETLSEVLLADLAGNAALTASFVEDLVQGQYKGDLPEWLRSQIAQGYENSKKM